MTGLACEYREQPEHTVVSPTSRIEATWDRDRREAIAKSEYPVLYKPEAGLKENQHRRAATPSEP